MIDSRPPAIFVGGALGADFLNSLATPANETIDWLNDGEGLLSWLGQARLLTSPDIATVQAAMSPRQLNAAAAEARKLREWFRGFVDDHKGRPLKSNALARLEPLNRLLGLDAVFWAVEPVPKNDAAVPTRFHLRPRRRLRTPESLLSPIAEEIAKFVCTADFRHVKACEGRNCSLLFVDETRHRSRRWCVMAICGNRAKQAAHRQRSLKDPLAA
jgi:predicted RNA-binding Zn ribbon-like protein